MASLCVQFFATPHEQLSWLECAAAIDTDWIVLEWLADHINELYRSDRFPQFYNRIVDRWDEFVVYLGNETLSALPLWRKTAAGHERIDFIRSKAIQFTPSRIVKGDVLLEGQLGIARPGYYSDEGIDPKPLRRWFKRVTSSFRNIGEHNIIPIVRFPDGTIRDVEKVVTTGAIQWRTSGRRLKQYPDGNAEYDVRFIDTFHK